MTDVSNRADTDKPTAPDSAAPPDRTPPLPAEPDAPPPIAAPLNPAPAVPPLKHCLAVISAGKCNGFDAIPELPALLESECPELAAILASSAIRTSLETYDRQDAESERQRAELMREANLANLCLLGAGVTSAVILAVAATAKDTAGQAAAASGQINLTLLLGLLTLAFGAGAAYFGFVARDQVRVARWQACRGDAELARHAVFTTMAANAGGTSAMAAIFGLAVVFRDLLEHQRKYFGNAVRRHRKSSEITSRWGGLASALAFIGGSGAIVASQGGGSWTNWIILAGVFGAAIGAYAANREALNRDRANADRYERTLVALDGIKGRTDDIALQIAAGEPKALAVFTGTIADLLATEFKQWQEGTAQAEASLAKLDGQLQQLSKDKVGGSARPPANAGADSLDSPKTGV